VPQDTCRISAPLLYRWCFAAALFCCVLVGLCLIVPIVRCGARFFFAPAALCLIGCVETVGMDVEIGVAGKVAQDGGLTSDDGGGFGSDHLSGSRNAAQRQFLPAALMICTGALCAPCYFAYAVLLGPVCHPFSVLMFKIFESFGCVRILPDGTLEFRNCVDEASCGWFVRHATQYLMAPGMKAPGRSYIGSFVNTSALMWFWCYLLFELFWNWNLMCEAAGQGASSHPMTLEWLRSLAPSPVHWLILLFAVSGALWTIGCFISDLFTSPLAPPRSAHEAHKWKMRRQLRVCVHVVLCVLLCTWGGLLFYFTYTQQQCASSSPSIHRLGLLLLLILVVFLCLALLLFVCVCIDCCTTGRMRLVVLLSEEWMGFSDPH